MRAYAYSQIALYLTVLTLLALPLGRYIHRVMSGQSVALTPLFGCCERALYRIACIDPLVQMSWSTYAFGLLLFNGLGALLLYALQRLQLWLPLNPAHLPAVAPDSAFNTAVSFVANASWQSYVPESTLSYGTQLLGITAQSFLSAATGIAALMALVRAFGLVERDSVGNVWADIVRSTLYVLLPLSLLLALLLVSQGSIQNWMPNHLGTLLQSPHQQQLLPMGPVASQTSAALLSGDGGGFFNANSAHPYANPTPFSNFSQMIAILLIPAALCHTFGRGVGDRRQGWLLFAAMAVVLAVASLLAMHAEQQGNPSLARLPLDQSWRVQQSGGNMEGKEARFGAQSSALFAAVTTGGGDGAVDSMHDSFTPIGGLVPMALMQLGEVIFGGPGSGLYGMLIYAIIAVFIASLMVGRAPEYLGKRIEAFELKMASIVTLAPALLALVGTAVAVTVEAGRKGPSNPGAHGFSEILYAFSSAANDNGSAFAGLAADTAYYNITTAVAMWFGRFVPLFAVMAIAGSLAVKKRRAAGAGTLPTHTPLFLTLLLGTVLLVGALAWLPALAMGPIAEQLQLAVRP